MPIEHSKRCCFEFARQKAGDRRYTRSIAARRVACTNVNTNLEHINPTAISVRLSSRFGLVYSFSSDLFILLLTLNDFCSLSVDAATGSCEQTAAILGPAPCCPLWRLAHRDTQS
jgi:hypothetical protein